jgi:hypothetical protein
MWFTPCYVVPVRSTIAYARWRATGFSHGAITKESWLGFSASADLLEKAREAGAEVTMETKDLTIDSSIGPVPVRIAFFKSPLRGSVLAY